MSRDALVEPDGEYCLLYNGPLSMPDHPDGWRWRYWIGRTEAALDVNFPNDTEPSVVWETVIGPWLVACCRRFGLNPTRCVQPELPRPGYPGEVDIVPSVWKGYAERRGWNRP